MALRAGVNGFTLKENIGKYNLLIIKITGTDVATTHFPENSYFIPANLALYSIGETPS